MLFRKFPFLIATLLLVSGLTACREEAKPQPPAEPAPTPTPMPDRFSSRPSGVIVDKKTGLEWIVGPDQDTTFAEAEAWIAECQVEGGGWRLPTRKELAELHIKGVGERNLDPLFETTGWSVWTGDVQDQISTWTYSYSGGRTIVVQTANSKTFRVFGVRSPGAGPVSPPAGGDAESSPSTPAVP